MNRHELDAAIAVGGRVGLRFEIFEGRSERRAKEIGLALRQRVETLPEKIEIRAGLGVDALRAAELEPGLFKPGAQRSYGLRGAEALGSRHRAQNAIDGEPAFGADEVRALESELGHRTGKKLGRVGAGERMQIGEREAAPWSAKHAQPRDAIVRIEERASERKRVDNLRAVLERFKIDGAKGDGGLAQSSGDGYKRFARPGKHGDTILLLRGAGSARMRGR